MKPLLTKDLPNFLLRFGNFIDAEIRSIKVTSATTMLVNIACQDSARGFDWLTICLEFSGILDAKIIEDTKLVHVDMSEGANILFEDNLFAFSIGHYKNISSLKFEENPF